MPSRWLPAVLPCLLASLLRAPPASAAAVLVVEGEDRHRDAGACGDGDDAMRPIATTDADGQTLVGYLHFPADGCWAEWDVDLPRAAEGLWFPASPTGCGRFEVAVDGILLGTTPPRCDGGFQWVGADGAIPAGAHTIRLTARLDPDGRHRVDLLQFRTAPPPPESHALRVEGEAAVRTSAACAPDGETFGPHHEPQSGEEPSGGSLLWYPNTACWAEWDVDLDQGYGRLVLAQEVGWPNDPQCGGWRVLVDGLLVGATPRDCAMDGLALVAIDLDPVLQAGAHTVRITSGWTPASSNGALDYLEFGPELSEGRTCRAGLVATSSGEGQVDASWPPADGAMEYGVTVTHEPANGNAAGSWGATATGPTYRFAGQAGDTYAIAVAAWGSEGQELARYCPAEVVAVPFTPGLAGMVLAGVAGPAAYALLRRRGR
jgi:hypothetical protein